VAAPAQEVVAESRVAEVAAPVSPESQAVAPAQATPAVVQTPARFDAAYLDNPRPVYPLMARRLHEEGRVLLRVRVSVNGSAMEVDVHTSSGSSRLDQSALETVRRWKFIPARQGNEAVAAHVLVPIVFSLKD
jgi:protein TonB